MLTLLTGGLKNVGDLLIADRARRLLRFAGENETFLEINRWLPLGPRLEEINETDAVILGGGPAYASHFYPGVYPLTEDLDAIVPPVVPLGLGWSGSPADFQRFEFTEKSLQALHWIHGRCEASSCRGTLTEQALRAAGVENAIMTGCPAWYHLPSLGTPLRIPTRLSSIAVSLAPPSNQLVEQQLTLLSALRRALKNATIHAVFHRGIGPDMFTSRAEGEANMRLAQAAAQLGCHVIDTAYDVSKLVVYDACDVHIGYRVHAHLYCLSIRRPSMLLEIDGRGTEANASLGMRGVLATSPNAVQETLQLLTNELSGRFVNSRQGVDKIEETFPSMLAFLQSLGQYHKKRQATCRVAAR